MNPAREALTRAVNKAIAAGSPVIVEQSPFRYNELRSVRALRVRDGFGGGAPAWYWFCDACARNLNPDGDKPFHAQRVLTPADTRCIECNEPVGRV